MSDVSEFLRGYFRWLRSMPDLLADRLDRWLMDMHRPLDDEFPSPCVHCKDLWPCPAFASAADRKAARAAGTTQRSGDDSGDERVTTA